MYAKAIGKRIKACRNAKGLTQEQLAEKLGCTPNHLSAIERGFYGPKLELLIQIMNVLECEPNEIFVDVVNTGYKIRSTEIAEQLEKISQTERKRILDVLDTMLKHTN